MTTIDNKLLRICKEMEAEKRGSGKGENKDLDSTLEDIYLSLKMALKQREE